MNISRLARWAKTGGALHGLMPGNAAGRATVENGGGKRRLAAVALLLAAGAFPDIAAGAPSVSFAWNANSETNISKYTLKYGTSSGSYTNSLETGTATSATVSGLAEGNTYYFAVTATNSAGAQSQASGEVSYFVPRTPYVSGAGWTVKSVDSEEEADYPAFYAFDGNPATFWHTQWRTASVNPPPHDLQIDLGSSKTVSGFRYLPRQDGFVVGYIGQYEFYVSADGVNWGSAAATGTFAANSSKKEVTFSARSGRYIRLRALTEANGGSHTSVAELEVIEGSTAPPNTIPVARDQSVTTAEDTTVALTLAGSDADGNPLTYAIVTNPANGILTGTPPNLSYKPSANYNGNDSFTFRVNDGTVSSPPATVSLSITPVNDSPTAIGKTLTTPQNTPLAIALTGGDADGDTLDFKIIGQPANGTLGGTAPNLTYTPAFGFRGTDSFTFQTSDSLEASETATITINVTKVNSVPVAISKSVSTKEDTALPITLGGSDDDGDSLSYTVLSQPGKGTLVGTAPNLTYTPNANHHGTDSFTFRVNDSTVNSPTGTISITVTPVNDKPVAIAKTLATSRNTPVAVTLSGSDIDGDAITFAMVTQPTKGALSGTLPNLTYTPANGSSGADSFTFRVHDGQEFSDVQTVTINISATNEAPVATAKSMTTAEDTAVSFVLAGTDKEGDTLSYSVLTQPGKGTLTGTAPNLSYTPDADFNGSDSFTFRVNDGTTNSTTATVSITVTPVNDAPVAATRIHTTQEDAPVSIVLGATDKDGDSLTYTLLSQPAKGTLTGTAPNLTYTPAANFNGSVSFTFKANDGKADSNTSAITISVSPVNDAPIVTGRSVSTTEGLPVAITLAGSDVDGDSLTFSVVSQPTKGTLTGTVPNLTYQPSSGFYGSDSFTYRANDGTVNSTVATVNITVAKKNPGNATLVSRSGWTLKYVDSQETFDAPATAAFDGDPATFWHTQWRNGVAPMPHEIQINLGAVQDICGFLYLPRQDGFSVGGVKDYEFHVSTDGVTWGTPVASGSFANTSSEQEVLFTTKSGQFIRLRVLSEIHGNQDTCIAELNVLKGSKVNAKPLANAQSLVTDANSALAVTLAGSDPEGSALTYSLDSSPSHGVLSGTPPKLTYVPDAGFSGSDSFTFTTNDGAVSSSAATISITVKPIPEVPGNVAPVFTQNPMTANAAQGEAFTGRLSATDANAGDTLVFSKISGPGWLTVSANGELGGTPQNANIGANNFTVKVTDSSNASTTATLVIRVANINDAPVFKVSPLVYPAGTEKTAYRDQSLAGTAYDPDDEALAYSKVSGPEWLTISRNGALAGEPPAGSAGTNTFVVRTTDASGASAEVTLQIWINSNTLPLPWSLDRVGTNNRAGAARYNAGIFTVAGAGALTPKADAGNFGWQMIGKKGQITARIRKVDDTGSATRVGIMIRASLAPNSRQVFLGVDGKGDYQLQHRTKAGGKAAKAAKRNKDTDKTWVRLVRNGNTITAFTSENGTKWTKVGSCKVNLPAQSYIGLSVSSGDKDKLNTAKFSNVRVAE